MSEPGHRNDRAARVLTLLLAALLLYTAWAWGGTRPSLHGAASVLACGLLITLSWAGRATRGAVWRDPLFGLGLAFLALLGLAWLNSGRVHYFDVGLHRWQYAPPHWPHAPAAHTRSDAAEALGWFFPAWALALSLRAPPCTPAVRVRLVRWTLAGAAALAVLGLVQRAAGARGPYGQVELTCDFFASFAYSNHAAAFFLLTASLSAGLLLRVAAAGATPGRMGGEIALGLAGTVGGLTGACLSLSRAGVLLSALLIAVVIGYGAWLGRRVPRSSGAPRLTAGLLVGALLAVAAVATLERDAIRREFTNPPASPAPGRLNLSLSGRPLFARAAWRMWLDHPLWGVGAGGFRYAVADYLPPDKLGQLQRRGWANVHCDPLHFLVEHGLVGGLLLVAALRLLLRPAVAAFDPRAPELVLGGLGLACVGVFAVIDLPFRCPAIFYHWLLVVIALPHLGGARPSLKGVTS